MPIITINRKEVVEYLAWSLLVTVVAWSIGFGVFLQTTEAANLTSVSDTLSNSNPTSTSNHVIAYTNATATIAGQTITINFDPITSLFGNVTGTQFADVTFSGATLVTACSAGADRVTLATTTPNTLTFTVCASNTVVSGTKTITIGNNRISNPGITGSYVIRIAGTQTNNADTRVAIVSNVTVTASVDTSLTFTVAGVASGTTINGVTTTLPSTATALTFGTLPLNSPVTMGQQLTLATNAQNGFTVTVVENQDLTSQTGAKIYLFSNGNVTSTPSPWTSPTNVLDSPNTYGHFGLTSNDADLNAGEFTSATFVGNFQSTSSRAVFHHTGPADGSTQNKGLASVAYRIQITALQAAATDYTNILTYVATPVF